MRSRTRCKIGWPPIEILPIDSVVGSIPNLIAITSATGTSLFCSASGCKNAGLCGCRRLADNVNHTIHGIGSPQSRSRTANYFNPVDILKHDVLDIPVHAGKQRGIHAPAIDEHQQLIVEATVKSSRSNGPFVLIDTGYFEAGNKPQCFWYVAGSRAPDILLRQDEDRGRRVCHFLRALGDGRHLHIQQVFHAHGGDVWGGSWILGYPASCQQCREESG